MIILIDLTRFNSRRQVDKEAIGLLRVQQFYHLCIARPYQISFNSIFKHIHTLALTQLFGSLFHSFIHILFVTDTYMYVIYFFGVFLKAI